MEDIKMIEEILVILKKCKNRLHKVKILSDVQKMVSTRRLVSQTKGTRTEYQYF